jgi:tetrahydromethanopterin S-methyltransferase subunit G
MEVTMPEKKWTDERHDDLNTKVDVGFARVDKRFDKVDARFDKVNGRFDKVEGKIEGGIKELREEMNERFDKVDSKFDTLDAKFDKKFDWLIGILLLSVLGILAAVIGPNVL